MTDATRPADGGTGATEAPALRMRSTPEDFAVVEEPLYPASGEGKHTFLLVEKRGRTTEQVAKELARLADAKSRDVGYAGRKDRHAVTRQWFSLEGVDPDVALSWSLEDAAILEARRHEHKLRTGHLRRNHFDVVLRGDALLDLAAIEARVETILRRGLPNRFGEQRFGRDGENAARARALLGGAEDAEEEEGARRSRRGGPRDRRAARFLVSALQSAVFNAVLDARIDAYDGVLLGDVARVEESGGLFWVDDPETDGARAAAFEISATGPIFGPKMRAPRDAAAALEAEVYGRFDLPPVEAIRLPRGVRAPGTRRPLRVRPQDLAVDGVDAGTGVRVRCALPPGAYVTVLLEALVGPVVDASRGGPAPDAALAAGVS